MAEFTQGILEFLQRNHFTDALAALQSELADQKSSNGCGFFNDSICSSLQINRQKYNGSHGGEQRPEPRANESEDIRSFKPNNLTVCNPIEKGISSTLKDEYASEGENLGFSCSSSKASSNKQMDSEFKARDSEYDSSTHEPYTEHEDANSEGTLYKNDQIPMSMNGYVDVALEQCTNSNEQRKLQDSAGTSEEILMLCKGLVQFENRIDNSFLEDPNLGLRGISVEKTRIAKDFVNNMIEAKGNCHETQDEEIIKQDISEMQFSPRKIHSREDLWDQIGTISHSGGQTKNHALKEADLDLKLHGRGYNLFTHDNKTSGPQIGNDMLDLDANNKTYCKFNQGKGLLFQEAVSEHEVAEKTPYIEECFAEERGYESNFGRLKEVPLKTAFPFLINDVFVNGEQILQCQALGEVAWAGSEGTVQGESKGLISTDTGYGIEGLPTKMLNYQGSPKQKKVESLNLKVNMGSSNESFPGFSSKMLQVTDYSNNGPKEEFDGESKMAATASGSNPAGKNLAVGSREPSNYWTTQEDSGIVDNNKDLGYVRQLIEDDSWRFSNEIYNPTDNEEGDFWDKEAINNKKNEHDNQIFAEDLYFPVERDLQSINELEVQTESTSGSYTTCNHNGQLISNHETNLPQTGCECQGSGQQQSGIEILRDAYNIQQSKASNLNFIDCHESMSSTSVGSCGYAETDTNVRMNGVTRITGGLSLYDKPVKYDRSSSSDDSIDRAQEVKKRQEVVDHEVVRYYSDSSRCHKAVHDGNSGERVTEDCFIQDAVKKRPDELGSQMPYGCSLYSRGFSFPSYSGEGDNAEFKEGPEQSFLSNNRNMVFFNGKKYSSHNMAGPSDIQIASVRKSKSSLSVWSARDGKVEDVERMGIKSKEGESLNDLIKDEDTGRVEDEEPASLGRLIQRITAEKDQFETFDLQIVHRRNRTGYEEVKDYHPILNTVIAGRYHVIQNLGSAVFSNVVQVHDLHTGLDLCLKIIKNNKEYFDQCLDEIKLLKLVNKHDPADKYHLLRLHDYFYYHEHLFIVCELLKANLYEFYKFNRESGGEAYFIMSRLQSIAIQCLEALEFLHNLGLIHCDLKPENILMKSYSRCEVKVIDLGSSCFVTDYLSSNVQSRPYRAPEVILGLPYNNKIDIWSLGCILPELFLGNVLFQGDSLATLLASIIAVVGPIDEEMLVMGCEAHKYFTKSYVLYEQNQDTNGIEFLTPNKTSLQSILQMGDQGFIDFVTYLLEINPRKRPSASAALQHPWLSHPYDPILS